MGSGHEWLLAPPPENPRLAVEQQELPATLISTCPGGSARPKDSWPAEASCPSPGEGPGCLHLLKALLRVPEGGRQRWRGGGEAGRATLVSVKPWDSSENEQF